MGGGRFLARGQQVVGRDSSAVDFLEGVIVDLGDVTVVNQDAVPKAN